MARLSFKTEALTRPQFDKNTNRYEQEYVAVNLIVNMEQVAVNSDGLLSRNMKRTQYGENSLEDQRLYIGSAPFVNAWLETYYLSTEFQQKYFWSYILCICSKIKQLDIELENQLVTIPGRMHDMSQNESLITRFTEVR
eukprot:79359_1